MTNYEMFRNRITNGKSFLKADAIKRVQTLANNLEITQEQADELMAIIEENGVDILPADAMGRLNAVEEKLSVLEQDVSTLKLQSGGSVLPHPGTDPAPKPGGGLTIGG